MMRFVQALATVIGSPWLLPVSFIAITVVAVDLFSRLDERHVGRGDAPHAALFFVVWQPGEAGQPFGYSRHAALDGTGVATSPRSFLMTQGSGRVDDGRSTVVAYEVLSTSASEQLIEVAYADDTYSSWSRYRATPTAVSPVYSRIMQPGFLFMALPVALGGAVAICLMGRWLRRKIRRPQ